MADFNPLIHPQARRLLPLEFLLALQRYYPQNPDPIIQMMSPLIAGTNPETEALGLPDSTSRYLLIPKWFIPIAAVSQIRSMVPQPPKDPENKKSCSFIVRTSSRDYLLRADSSKEFHRWTFLLSRVSENYSKETDPESPSSSFYPHNSPLNVIARLTAFRDTVNELVFKDIKSADCFIPITTPYAMIYGEKETRDDSLDEAVAPSPQANFNFNLQQDHDTLIANNTTDMHRYASRSMESISSSFESDWRKSSSLYSQDSSDMALHSKSALPPQSVPPPKSDQNNLLSYSFPLQQHMFQIPQRDTLNKDIEEAPSNQQPRVLSGSLSDVNTTADVVQRSLSSFNISGEDLSYYSQPKSSLNEPCLEDTTTLKTRERKGSKLFSMTYFGGAPTLSVEAGFKSSNHGPLCTVKSGPIISSLNNGETINIEYKMNPKRASGVTSDFLIFGLTPGQLDTLRIKWIPKFNDFLHVANSLIRLTRRLQGFETPNNEGYLTCAKEKLQSTQIPVFRIYCKYAVNSIPYFAYHFTMYCTSYIGDLKRVAVDTDDDPSSSSSSLKEGGASAAQILHGFLGAFTACIGDWERTVIARLTNPALVASQGGREIDSTVLEYVGSIGGRLCQAVHKIHSLVDL